MQLGENPTTTIDEKNRLVIAQDFGEFREADKLVVIPMKESRGGQPVPLLFIYLYDYFKRVVYPQILRLDRNLQYLMLSNSVVCQTDAAKRILISENLHQFLDGSVKPGDKSRVSLYGMGDHLEVQLVSDRISIGDLRNSDDWAKLAAINFSIAGISNE